MGYTPSPRNREKEVQLVRSENFAENGPSSGCGWAQTGRIYSITW
jgi:hypothetical protein